MSFAPWSPGISVRLFRPDLDQSGLSPLLEELRENQPQLPGFDETIHRLVAVGSNNQVLGFANIWKPPDSDCAELSVTWDYESKITVCLDLLLESVNNAAAQGAASVLVYVDPRDQPLAKLLVEQGFEQGSGYRRLSMRLHLEPEEPVWPSGLELRSFEALADPSLLIDASNKCYTGLWGHKAADEQVVESILASFPRDGMLLLTTRTGQIIGICKTTATPTGYIDGPGLATPYRDRLELYAEMARAALNWLYRAGRRQVTLESWGDPDSVVQVYTEMGFKVEVETSAYLLHIDTDKSRS